MSASTPRYPDLRILLTLARLMARFGKRRLPIAQHELLRHLRTDGRRMARSTLNYHLVALERAALLRRRSYRPKYVSGQVTQRVTAYSLALHGQRWVSLWTTMSAIPAARPSGVRNSGHIRSSLRTYGVRGTKRAKITRDNSAPAKRGRGPR